MAANIRHKSTWRHKQIVKINKQEAIESMSFDVTLFIYFPSSLILLMRYIIVHVFVGCAIAIGYDTIDKLASRSYRIYMNRIVPRKKAKLISYLSSFLNSK